MPASTSPLPPRERPGVAGGVHAHPARPGPLPPCRAPLSTTTAFHACAYRRAVPSRSALICAADRPVSRAISPGWGVTISSPAGCGKAASSASSRLRRSGRRRPARHCPQNRAKAAAQGPVSRRRGPHSGRCRQGRGQAAEQLLSAAGAAARFPGKYRPRPLPCRGTGALRQAAAAALTTGSTLARVTMPRPVRNAPSAASSAAPR